MRYVQSLLRVFPKNVIPYSQLLKQVKGFNIPIPPSGYWTKLRCGKPVSQVELTGSPGQFVDIYKSVSTIISKPTEDIQAKAIPSASNQKLISDESSNSKASPSMEYPETIEHYGAIYNIYHRETLYQEVWSFPVIEVAKKYKVSDVTIHKICKSLNIPKPPAVYWAKVKAGKTTKKIPLPKGNYPDQKTGLRSKIINSNIIVPDKCQCRDENAYLWGLNFVGLWQSECR